MALGDVVDDVVMVLVVNASKMVESASLIAVMLKELEGGVGIGVEARGESTIVGPAT